MYERFSDRARTAMARAEEHAQRLGHEYIGIEHVLLALLDDPGSVGCGILTKIGVPLNALKERVTLLTEAPSGNTVPGKRLQTPRTKKVIEFAIEEARNRGSSYVGTEHLLLGLSRPLEDEGRATKALNAEGATYPVLTAAFPQTTVQATRSERNRITITVRPGERPLVDAIRDALESAACALDITVVKLDIAGTPKKT